MIELNTSSLSDALNFVELVTGRDSATSLNRAGLHVIIGSGSGPGAMQLTPKADRGAIRSISDAQIRGFLIKRLKRLGKWPISNKILGQMVKKERARRMSSVGYAAFAGWNNAARELGGRGIRTTEAFERSEAAHGRAHRATPVNLVTEIVNTAPAAERIGFDALQQGIENAAQDLNEYGTRKLQERFLEVTP